MPRGYRLIEVHDESRDEELYAADDLRGIREFIDLKAGLRPDGGDGDGG